MSPDDLVLNPRGIRFQGRYMPASIGRGGITRNKSEGDHATPAGIWRITGMLYRADRITRPAPWAHPIGPRDLWCDDPNHPHYNHPVKSPFSASHECLRRADHLYDLILTTDWNWPYARPAKGSAIFLHRWRRPGFPTEGCIALRPDHLHWLARRISQGTRVCVF